MDSRGVSPVLGVILMIAISVLLAASVAAFVFGLGSDLATEPAPVVGDTTGEFEAGSNLDEQIVRITHIAGDDVDIEETEILVRATGPELDTDARLVDLPGDGSSSRSLDDSNIERNDDLINQCGTGCPFLAGDYSGDQIIVVEDTDTWTSGETIQFSIGATGADFSEDPGSNPEADELEVTIVHTETETVISNHEFEP